MPREWGREPFYTFMPRERNEGMGGVNAVSVNAFYKPQPQLKWEVSWGYYKLSDVKNVFLNKYGMPAYTQLNVGMSYQFKGFLEGLDAQLLVVRQCLHFQGAMRHCSLTPVRPRLQGLQLIQRFVVTSTKLLPVWSMNTLENQLLN